MQANLYLWLVPLLPLIGAALNGIWGRRATERRIGAVAIAAVAASFLLCLRAFFSLGATPYIENHFRWIAAGTFGADVNFYFDPLSAVMALVVTGVSLLIHIYAASYMSHEKGYHRFFAYMNLFLFFMLLLVLGGNYVLVFAGWEGVGLCSYLLIGFYYQQPDAASAGKKAFLVNRVGDFGFLLAILLIFRAFQTVNFAEVFPQVTGLPTESGYVGPLTWICLLLLMGASGKSAQIPLYVWLPDAMLGPTPVSALIHAATMVTAGVYVISRSAVLYLHAPEAMLVLAIIGALTAFYAATIALVQTDIKRVLAYSTISQIGYMILACGVAAFPAAIFHLMTHAFFKALLFLGAGSVIHSLHGEQDLRNMGGLRSYLPRTYWTFFAACLAIAALPPTSGFFSKDAILWAAYSSPYGGPVFWTLAVATAGLTSFYMFRLFFLAFHGERRFTDGQFPPSHAPSGHTDPSAPHESPGLMTWPLIILALLSICGGWVGIPALWGGNDRFSRFLSSVFPRSVEAGTTTHVPSLELAFTMVSVVISLAGIALAYLLYVGRPRLAAAAKSGWPRIYRLLSNKYYVDELYDALIVRPLVAGSREVLWKRVDSWAIDGSVNEAARNARDAGNILRQIQSGNIRSYAGWVLLGAVLLICYMVTVA